MSVLSDREAILYRIAKAALPSFIFSDPANQHEILAGFAKQVALVWESAEQNLLDTLMSTASTAGLNQHAKDRATRRQTDESDDALLYRLRFLLEDSVTIAGLRAKATAILTSYGATIPTGYPAITELRRDRMFFGSGQGVQINCVAAALIADGETFTIGGAVYEFDKTGSVTSGRTAVDIAAATTATDVATAVAAALEARYPGLVTSSTSFVVLLRARGALSDTVADAGFSIFRKKSYWSRGYRLTGSSRSGTVIVCMLPYGTTAACADSVAEALRQAKAGGVKVIVERRLVP